MGAPAKPYPPTHPLSLDLALVLVVAIAIDGVIAWLTAGIGPTTSVRLAFFVHVGFAIYIGGLYGVRRVTWLILIATYVLAQFVIFLGYVMPFGQLAFWLAAQPVVGPALAVLARVVPQGTTLSGVLTAVLGVALLASIVAMQAAARRTRSAKAWAGLIANGIALALVGSLIGGLVVPAPDSPDDLLGGVDPLPTPAMIVPDWHGLYGYAMLRAVPGRLAAVIVVFVAILLPALAAWFRAERLRTGRTRWAWRSACLGLVVAWVLLGWLGAQPAEGTVITASLALTLYWFLFFLVVPFALGHLRNKI